MPVSHWWRGWHSVTSTFTNWLHTVLISASLSLTDFSWRDTWFPSEQPTHLIPGLHFSQFSIFHPQLHWLLNTEAEQQENSRALETEGNISKPHKDSEKRINPGRSFKTTAAGQGLIVAEDWRWFGMKPCPSGGKLARGQNPEGKPDLVYGI